MFTRCLLPLLLAPAALGQRPHPFIVSKHADDLTPSGDMTRQAKYYIPTGQCYGNLHPKQQEQLQCPQGTHMAKIKVDVRDFSNHVTVEVSDGFEGVLITREPPCQGAAVAVVDVVVTCERAHAAAADALLWRRPLSPAL